MDIGAGADVELGIGDATLRFAMEEPGLAIGVDASPWLRPKVARPVELLASLSSRGGWIIISEALETGIVVTVPMFVAIGDKIRVDTRSGDYVTRV